jgi:hypothetical protein
VLQGWPGRSSGEILRIHQLARLSGEYEIVVLLESTQVAVARRGNSSDSVSVIAPFTSGETWASLAFQRAALGERQRRAPTSLATLPGGPLRRPRRGVWSGWELPREEHRRHERRRGRPRFPCALARILRQHSPSHLRDVDAGYRCGARSSLRQGPRRAAARGGLSGDRQIPNHRPHTML